MKFTKRGNTEDTWYAELDERQLAEVEFAKLYASQFEHGTDGHNRLLLIAKMAELLDQYQSALKIHNINLP